MAHAFLLLTRLDDLLKYHIGVPAALVRPAFLNRDITILVKLRCGSISPTLWKRGVNSREMPSKRNYGKVMVAFPAVPGLARWETRSFRSARMTAGKRCESRDAHRGAIGLSNGRVPQEVFVDLASRLSGLGHGTYDQRGTGDHVSRLEDVLVSGKVDPLQGISLGTVETGGDDE
jgi:hypothetical protein